VVGRVNGIAMLVILAAAWIAVELALLGGEA
jgi:hypothetical protein